MEGEGIEEEEGARGGQRNLSLNLKGTEESYMKGHESRNIILNLRVSEDTNFQVEGDRGPYFKFEGDGGSNLLWFISQ